MGRKGAESIFFSCGVEIGEALKQNLGFVSNKVDNE